MSDCVILPCKLQITRHYKSKATGAASALRDMKERSTTVVLFSSAINGYLCVHRLNALLKIKQCKLQLQREMQYCSVCTRVPRMYSNTLLPPLLLARVLQTLLTGNLHCEK